NGISTSASRLVAAIGRSGIGTSGTTTTAASTITTTVATGTTRTALVFRTGRFHGGQIVAAQGITLVDPDLHANDAVCRLGFGEAVVDVSTQSVQRHAAFAIPLGTSNFDTVQTTRRHDLDAL